ncbi:hypothetical protein N7495_009935 [Penicillium taxi]|uniref:uncharacterized protein n=1 Tax=Penicillium taxi TaxID=168475 RepID=UPI0025456EFD|nr:uncharacterized protein N7495_009935 [Penicillium taxi]KAJ5885425.1 hypothetical protein N7495_009935 [Penicillium taxi]
MGASLLTRCRYQSDAISSITTTIGYLSALISVLSQALLPRAKFMKIMFFDLLATCVSASLCCLTILCAIKAREHGLPPNATESERNGFSSNACAVSAVWLILIIWVSNYFRALKPPELTDPMVAFSIFAGITITRAGTFTTLTEGLQFVEKLLKGFMIGFAIATAVSLFIYPVTSRGNVFHDIRDYATSIDDVLDSQISFAEGDAMNEIFTGRGFLHRTRTAMSSRDGGPSERDKMMAKQNRLKATMAKLNGLHAKLHADLVYSKDEIAWGKLSAKDLSNITTLLRTLLLPLAGMSMLPEILQSIVKSEGVRDDDLDDLDDVNEEALKQSEIRKVGDTHLSRLVDASVLVKVGLQYFLLKTELIKAKNLEKKRKVDSEVAAGDEEARGESLSPLQADFVTRFEQELHSYYSRRKYLPKALASLEAFSTNEKAAAGSSGSEARTFAVDNDVRQEFFLILYMGHLQDTLLNATLQLVKFAESKVTDGTMKRGRLIFPKQTSLREWFSLSSSSGSEKKGKNDTKRQSDTRQSSHVDLSVEQHIKPSTGLPDPDHLPPENIFERSSTVLRTISHVLKSDQSIFGFRVAAASFCIAILAFLHQTQNFFIAQRGIWALIVVIIGMNPTSGQSLFGFATRILATVFSMVLSLIVWYIVDGKTAGVIIFLYIGNVFEYFGASVISIVTFNVIIGYSLQVRKIGVYEAESNGQAYYPIYVFGPIKLLCVVIGCAISFFWVLFPFPITAKFKLRQLLGSSLFVLAKFYSAMHATIQLWLSNDLGSTQDLHSPAYQLQTSRRKILKQEMMLLTALRMHSHFTTFEPPIGGKFPKQIYDSMIGEVQRSLWSMSLMAHTTQSLEGLSAGKENASQETEDQDHWKEKLADIALKSVDFNSHKITSLLCHLSAAIANGQPLPPYLSTPDSFPLARQMKKIDDELLNIRHVADPEFSAFVALEVLRSVISFSLQDLLE